MSTLPGDEAPQRLDRRVIYRSPWVELYVDRVAFPNGRIIEQHHFLHFPHQAVAALVENDAGEILMVQAYRYVTGTVQWEVPAGRIEDGEDIFATAAREVTEEGGCLTTGHALIYSFHAINGIGDIVHHIVRCRVTSQHPEFDRSEVRAVRWFPRAELVDMLRARTIGDGYTLTAVLLLLNESL